MICALCKYDQEMENINDIFCDNGYLGNIIKCIFEHKNKMLQGSSSFCSYLVSHIFKIALVKQKSQILANKVSACVTSGFSAVRLHVVLGTNSVFFIFVKHGLSYLKNSSIVYIFKCQCEAKYVRQTNQ